MQIFPEGWRSLPNKCSAVRNETAQEIAQENHPVNTDAESYMKSEKDFSIDIRVFCGKDTMSDKNLCPMQTNSDFTFFSHAAQTFEKSEKPLCSTGVAEKTGIHYFQKCWGYRLLSAWGSAQGEIRFRISPAPLRRVCTGLSKKETGHVRPAVQWGKKGWISSASKVAAIC